MIRSRSLPTSTWTNAERETLVLIRIAHPGLGAHVFKRAISFLVVKRVAFARQPAWTTHHRHAAKLAEVLAHTSLVHIARARRQMVEIDLHVTGNEKIETPIAVVVAPARARAPTLARDADFFSHVGERAITVVAIKT